MSTEDDSGVRALLLAGCADTDLAASLIEADRDDPYTSAYLRLVAGRTRLPVVGTATGPLSGNGRELLLGCDVIVASTTACFAFTHMRQGRVPVQGGALLAGRMPMGVALELLLTGDPIDAPRAQDFGLVNRVARPEDVQATALALADRIAGGSPHGLAAVKDLVRLAVTAPSLEAARRETWRERLEQN